MAFIFTFMLYNSTAFVCLRQYCYMGFPNQIPIKHNMLYVFNESIVK